MLSLQPGYGSGQAIHAIGHAVGLWHEQSREDRDTYIRIDWQHIMPGMEDSFDQYITDGDDLGEYDYGSIMHFPATAFSVDGQPTIIAVAGQRIGQREGLSEGDIAAVAALYGDRPINASLTERGLIVGSPPRPGRPYTLSFSVEAPPHRYPVTGVSTSDVPPDGLVLPWIVTSNAVELRRSPADLDVEVEDRSSGGWLARFPLLIPYKTKSAARHLVVVVAKADGATVDVVILAKVPAAPDSGKRDRFEEYRRLTLNLGMAMSSGTRAVVSDVYISPMAHLGLRPAHEWMTPAGVLSISVADALATFNGTLATRATDSSTMVEQVDDSVDWYGIDPRAAGTIEQTRAASETFRELHVGYLDDVDRDDLAARLRGFTPQYGWDPITYESDVKHEQAWAAVAASPELFNLAFYGHQLYKVFFPPDTKLRTWLDAPSPATASTSAGSDTAARRGGHTFLGDSCIRPRLSPVPRLTRCVSWACGSG